MTEAISGKLTIIIPAKNEEKNIRILYKQIKDVLRGENYNYEIIFVDDGSTDNTYQEFVKLIKNDKEIRAIKLRGNWGKSYALQAGFNHAKGDIIITMDADLQDDPREIPNFIKKINEGNDIVSGWKKTRHDPKHNVAFSRIYNKIISLVSGVIVHDTNCGYKAYRSEVAKDLNLYGELYRLIPVFAAKSNYRFAEIPVNHRPRIHGKSKYKIYKNIKGLLDLITVFFLTSFSRRPGHFFGMLGIFSFAVGFVIGIYISYLRITTGSIQYRYPLLFLGMLSMIIGVQLFTTGLLAELIVSFNHKKDKEEIIEKKV